MALCGDVGLLFSVIRTRTGGCRARTRTSGRLGRTSFANAAGTSGRCARPTLGPARGAGSFGPDIVMVGQTNTHESPEGLMSHLFGNGRFETLGDPKHVCMERSVLWKTTNWCPERIPTTFAPRSDYWLSGFERTTGRPVLISPRGYGFHWKFDLELEAVARRIQRLALPGILPIWHVGGGIVFADPPPAQPRPTLSYEQAARLAFDVADKAARLQAEGCRDLAFGPSNLRLVQSQGVWQVQWIVPGVVALDAYDCIEALPPVARKSECKSPRWHYGLQVIPRDIWRIADFFLGLLAPHERLAPPTGQNSFGAVYSPADVAAAHTTLLRVSAGGPAEAGIEDVATLARALAVLANVPRNVADAVPVVRTLPRVFPDWDEVVTEGETLLASEPHYKDSIRLTLAGAYHQRASRSWARGEHVRALEDVDRAIVHDPFFTYQTTRAILLGALGRHEEARVNFENAFQNPPPVGDNPSRWGARTDAVSCEEMSRAYLARGFALWRARRWAEAYADVRKAHELHASKQTQYALERLQRRIGL